MAPTTVEQYRHLAEDVLEQVGRIAESIRFVSQLARFQQPASDLADITLNTVLEESIADQRQAWDAAQMTVMYCRPRAEFTIRISISRLRQMLFHALQLAQKLSRPGDTVQIELQQSANKVRLKILHPSEEPGGATTDPFPGDNSVNRMTALMDAIVSEAGGRFSVQPRPFLMLVDFPRARKVGARTSSKIKLRRKPNRSVAGDR